MVIEYAGTVIRAVLTDKREKYYDSKVSELTASVPEDIGVAKRENVANFYVNTFQKSFLLYLQNFQFNSQTLSFLSNFVKNKIAHFFF